MSWFRRRPARPGRPYPGYGAIVVDYDVPDDFDPPAMSLDGTPPDPPRVPDPLVHAVMYRDYKFGTLCNSGAWGTPELFTVVTDNVTCPGCRNKIDGGGPTPLAEAEAAARTGWAKVAELQARVAELEEQLGRRAR